MWFRDLRLIIIGRVSKLTVLPYMHMYRFLVVIGDVGGGRCCDSGVCGAVCGNRNSSRTTRQ